MDREIKRLRNKFFILSSVIAFIVIFVVMLVLNILMQVYYSTELKAASDMLTQTAYTNSADVSTERIPLSVGGDSTGDRIHLADVKKNGSGDYVIERDPSLIKSIKLIGSITCTAKNASWYCAGGGVCFELPDKEGKGTARYIYKEYKFNRDNTEVRVDFTGRDDFQDDGKPVDADITDVSKSGFGISSVWWASSSENASALEDKSVTLTLTDIEIEYLKDSGGNTDETVSVSSDTLGKNEAGDYIVYRDPTTIKNIKLIGNITCTNENAGWFCAGGGVYFELPDKDENKPPQFIYKEYKFNRDNTELNIDLTKKDDFVVNGEYITADIADVSKDRFYISCVWWASSSENAAALEDNSVILTLTDVEIEYLENVTIGSSENYEVPVRSFSDLDPSSIPDSLGSYSSFYFITDKKNALIEINNGNSKCSFDRESARALISGGDMRYDTDETEYTCTVKDNGAVRVYAFIGSSQAQESNKRLLLLSMLSGGGMMMILLVLIYLISGRAVRPISQSYSKQKEFISNASHELKLPITVISATADLMEKKNGPDRLTDCIYAQVKKMGRLVNEMLSLSRLSEPKRYDDAFEDFDLSRTVNNSLLYFESRAFEEKKQMISDIAEGVSIKGVPEKIGDLVDILIDNALKYSDENGDIKVTLKKVKNKAVFTCENPCRNFDSEDIPHLFDRFYRGDKAHSNETEGFGLGLSIAKETMELHHGEIKVEYIEGNVRFTVTL